MAMRRVLVTGPSGADRRGSAAAVQDLAQKQGRSVAIVDVWEETAKQTAVDPATFLNLGPDSRHRLLEKGFNEVRARLLEA